MSQSPKRIFLRKAKSPGGSWTKGWQDLWRSDSGDVEYVRADIPMSVLLKRWAEADGGRPMEIRQCTDIRAAIAACEEIEAEQDDG